MSFPVNEDQKCPRLTKFYLLKVYSYLEGVDLVRVACLDKKTRFLIEDNCQRPLMREDSLPVKVPPKSE